MRSGRARFGQAPAFMYAPGGAALPLFAGAML